MWVGSERHIRALPLRRAFCFRGIVREGRLMVHRVTRDDTTSTVEGLRPFAGYLMYRSIIADRPAEDWTFGELAEHSVFNEESILCGLDRLLELAEAGPVWYPVYDKAACTDDPEKADVRFWFFPADPKRKVPGAPFIIACAGGAYKCVCTMIESIPVAARLNALGYDVVIPNYRVGMEHVMPKPLEDVAATYRAALARKEQLGLEGTSYVVCGFSAGGSLVSEWGVASVGYECFGIPAPRAIFSIYPSLSPWRCGPAYIADIMFGPDATEETYAPYDVPVHVNASYPPTYLLFGARDASVPVKNSVEFARALEEHGVPHRVEVAETAGHGFGDGRDTDAEGWPVRAIHFLEGLA